jgi:hypothetical protein
MKKLRCSANQITSLPDLPKGLIQLCCDNCELTELPKLHEGLIQLCCKKNNITKLPYLPNSLKSCNINTAYNFIDNTVITKYDRNFIQISDFGNISITDNFNEYRKCHNALINFQTLFRAYLYHRNMNLKQKCRIKVCMNKIKFNTENIPQELIEYLNYK